MSSAALGLVAYCAAAAAALVLLDRSGHHTAVDYLVPVYVAIAAVWLLILAAGGLAVTW